MARLELPRCSHSHPVKNLKQNIAWPWMPEFNHHCQLAGTI